VGVARVAMTDDVRSGRMSRALVTVTFRGEAKEGIPREHGRSPDMRCCFYPKVALTNPGMLQVWVKRFGMRL
jgi:hypothetical protein